MTVNVKFALAILKVLQSQLDASSTSGKLAALCVATLSAIAGGGMFGAAPGVEIPPVHDLTEAKILEMADAYHAQHPPRPTPPA